MNHVTRDMNFYHTHNPCELVKTYASPLYVYNELILRQKCHDMKNLCNYPNIRINYAMKANTNLQLLSIIHDEGLCIDASSPGEVVAARAAGFETDEIMFIVNNVSPKELEYATNLGLIISVDSLSQLETYGKLVDRLRTAQDSSRHKSANLGRIAIRFNSGIGGGHHKKVITGGDGTKFGIMPKDISLVKHILAKYSLQLVGINHHIGSQNWGDLYSEGVVELLRIAKQFPGLEFIDLGGGFAIPYNKQCGEQALDLSKLGQNIDKLMYDFAHEYGKFVTFILEPGRYIVAECGVLLGTVHAMKNCGQTRYAGTDIGFSVFARTTLYDAHHDIEIYRDGSLGKESEVVSIVGNQCESGDYIARDRYLPLLREGDILGILDAGAYGYSMSSQYNHRPRPAEVLIQSDGAIRVIRERESLEDLLR